ncbi:MAG: DUF4389 domain-containing protein [Gammaproteobacteria bacterium]|nr:DUF4389 domain-containing protein [Gammaproteobacteria bacterium]
MNQEMKDSVRESGTWWRLLWILVFAFIYSVAEFVVVAVVVIQFGFVLFKGTRNAKLLEFGESLSEFIYQILQYVTFNSDERPFPFGEWPQQAQQH